MKAKLLYLLVGLALGVAGGQWLASDEAPQPHTFPHTIEFDRGLMHVPYARKEQVL